MMKQPVKVYKESKSPKHRSADAEEEDVPASSKKAASVDIEAIFDV